MRGFTRLMKALSDPNRVKVIKMLQNRDMCVCEITAALDLAQPTVSAILKILEEAGLVRGFRSGQWINYRLAPQPDPMAKAMLELLGGWLENDPEVAGLRLKLPGISRENICCPKSSTGKPNQEDRHEREESAVHLHA